jgi:hypothetical protein
MKTYLDNLRPFEKRLVVGVALALFVVFNLWFIVPLFGDWDLVRARLANAQSKLRTYNAEIQQSKKYQALVRQMEGEGYSVPAEDQSLHFANEVQTREGLCGVSRISSSRILDRTNQFFIEKSQQLTYTLREQQLVDFLVNLSAGNSMIRVRELALRPDPPHQNLSATVKLVASYQKKTSGRTGGATRRSPTANASD